MEQINLFQVLYEKYQIKKPIRLIELFGGIGSQAKALENLHANFTHYKLVEFDKYPVMSYNAIHGTDFKPTDITKIHASDLEIKDKDKYEYIMSYSFPCQDLSLAGKGKGMSKDSGTRSGLLWEVERLLNECTELPQVLLMENVPQVIGVKNIEDFKSWVRFLESKGYSNYYQILNAKDYGIPQNRQRCFMVSILGEAYYEFPKGITLKLKLKDMLETEVDERYYLSEKNLEYVLGNAVNPLLKDFYNRENAYFNKEVAYCLNTKIDRRVGDSNYIVDNINKEIKASDFLIIKNATKKGYLEAKEGDGIDISSRMETHRGTVQKDMIQTIKAQLDVGVVDKGLRIRKLTPKECWRLMGFSDIDFDKASKVNSNVQLYKQAGNSIVVNVLMAIFSQLL